MNSLNQIKERHLIPRWQNLTCALNSGELLYSKRTNSCIEQPSISESEILESKVQWEEEKSLISALEYLSKQQVCNIELDTKALSFLQEVIQKNDEIPNVVLDFLYKNPLSLDVNRKPQIVINLLKKKTRAHVEDGYLWLEMARNYLMLGQNEKAEKALMIAHGLAPNDRYIARSMMKFYHHVNDIEKALYWIRKMESLKTDPWILSGEISLSCLCGKTSHNIKTAKNIIESNNYSNRSISELAGEIATLEIAHANARNGKKLFAKSIVEPTENAFAQAAWVNQNKIEIPALNSTESFKLNNNFEGEIYLAFSTQKDNVDWTYIFSLCEKWSDFQPFSREPIYLGGNIAADFLEDYKKAYKFTLQAYNLNKNDCGFINNLAYASILDNNSEQAFKFLKIQKGKIQTEEEKMVYYATNGMYQMRFGDVESGKSDYIKSSEFAKKINIDMYVRVMAFYYRELERIGATQLCEMQKKEILKKANEVKDFMLIQLLKKFKILS